MVDFAAHTARIINRIGQPVTLTPSGQSPRVVQGVFSATPSDAFGLVAGYAPVVRVCAAESNDIAEGDQVTIGEKSFVVTGFADDRLDSGDRVLRLEAA